jgi:hypothetical protein
VGAHWQNGIAERFIGSIVQHARTILLHVMTKWPSVITEDMWPCAIRHMVNFHNASILRGKSISPYTLFTGQEPPWTFTDFRVFGCPSYVLAKRLQDGDNYSKWKARYWQGVYIGNSTCHAGHIPLIYNPMTTHISPQYHVTYDEGFTSIQTTLPDVKEAILQRLYNKAQWSHSSEYATDDDLYYFDTLWMDPPLAPKPEGRGRKRKTSPPTCQTDIANIAPRLSTPAEASLSADDVPQTEGAEIVAPGRIHTSEGVQINAPGQRQASEGDQIQAPGQPHAFEGATNYVNLSSEGDGDIISPADLPKIPPDINTPQYSRTSTSVKPQVTYELYLRTTDFQNFKRAHGIEGNIYVLHAPVLHHHTLPHTETNPDITQISTFSAFYDLPFIPTEHTIQSYLAMDNKDDTLTQSQMLRTTDKTSFLAAQTPEIRGLEHMDVFSYKPMSDLTPYAKLLSSIWSYHRKRRPNGELTKHKARLCVDGSQQLFGRDYWETYAPVVTWSTVRLVLLLATILNLKSRQVDYTQAFPQAELSDPVFMRLPQGWHISTDGTLQPHPDPT